MHVSPFCCGTATSAFFSPAGQGRLFYWNPGFVDGKKALPSSHPELLARFAKEASVTKTELFPDIDTLDVVARQEALQFRGGPQLLQLPLVPAYALTIHKTQALSIKHRANGCLEAVGLIQCQLSLALACLICSGHLCAGAAVRAGLPCHRPAAFRAYWRATP